MATGRKTGGRQSGTPNKLTADVKDMILAALDQAGGVNYLLAQSESNPSAFMTLIGKVLPMQLTGMNGGPIEHTDPNRLPEAVAGLLDRITGRSEESGAPVSRTN